MNLEDEPIEVAPHDVQYCAKGTEWDKVSGTMAKPDRQLFPGNEQLFEGRRAVFYRLH